MARRANPVKEMVEVKKLVNFLNKKLLRDKSPNMEGNPFGAYYNENYRKWIIVCGCTWIFFNRKTRPIFNLAVAKKLPESLQKHITLFYMGEKGMESFRSRKRRKDFKYRLKG